MKDPFKYICILVFVCYAAYWGYKYYFPTTYVYIDETNMYHSTPTCDNIPNMQFLEEIGEVTGSKKVDEKEVFYDQKYIMCDYCFSTMKIEYRTRYLNRSLK